MNKNVNLNDRMAGVIESSANILSGKQEVDMGTVRVISRYSGEWKNKPTKVVIENGQAKIQDNDCK